MKTTVAQFLKHDFTKGSLSLYDSNENQIYYEDSDGYWDKQEYDSNGNQIYYEDSDGYWDKQEYDSNDNIIYSEKSDGDIIYYIKIAEGTENLTKDSFNDKKPKGSCNGKVVEIDGKKYKLTEI